MTEIEKNGVRKVYVCMLAFLDLFEDTKGFDCLPKGVSGKLEDFLDPQIDEIQMLIDSFAEMESEGRKVKKIVIYSKLQYILDEIKFFVHDWEVPGVVRRWRQINPSIDFYSCERELRAGINREFYHNTADVIGIVKNLDDELIGLRKKYYNRIQEKQMQKNRTALGVDMFGEELRKTMELVFRNDFEE